MDTEPTMNGSAQRMADRRTSSAFSMTRLLTAARTVNPNGAAVRQGERATTWQALADRVQRIAGALHGLGLEPGDRVVVLASNSDTLYALLIAVPWAGGVLVPLNTRLAAPELLACLEDSGSRLLLTDRAHAETSRLLIQQPTSVQRLLLMDAEEDEPDSLRGLERRAEALPDQGRADEDAAVLCYTGGTTGRAKGVVLTHRSLISGCLQWQSVARLDREDCLLIVTPMFHLAGLSNCYGAMLVGGTAEIVDRFDPDRVLAVIEHRRVSYAVLVPTMIRALLDRSAASGYDIRCLKSITYGGSPIAERDLRAALAHLPASRFIQIYGQTESGVTTALMPEQHDPARGRLRSAGRPVAGVELRIVDSKGHAAPAGTWGEICIRSPGVASGYWNRPEETAQAFRGGWLHTGDIGYLDETGFLHLVDRARDMIISGGENVYSVEVEQVLDEHPAVAESAIIGLPSARWGEEVHAVVRLEAGAVTSAEELIAHCRQRLAAYKCPRSVRFLTDPLPRNPIGKVLKRELRRAARGA